MALGIQNENGPQTFESMRTVFCPISIYLTAIPTMSRPVYVSLCFLYSFGLLALTSGCSSQDDAPVADLVLRSGKVVTLDPSMPEAEAVAVKGDTILAVGSDAEIAAFIGGGAHFLHAGNGSQCLF